MPILTEILGGGLGKLVKDVIGTFHLDPAQKLEFEKIISEHEHEIQMKEYELQVKAMEAENAMVAAQKDIIVAEMAQTDNFTKRARPMIVYAGLAAIFLAHIILPYIVWFTKQTVPPIELPEDFWYVWGGVCSIWFVGRTFERMGTRTKAVKVITGSK
jgi:hypothetical protein